MNLNEHWAPHHPQSFETISISYNTSVFITFLTKIDLTQQIPHPILNLKFQGKLYSDCHLTT